MKILADENVDGPLVAWLRAIGHDVLWAAQTEPGCEDAAILEQAIEQERVILTQDRDFGDLVFRGTRRPAGVVYVRIRCRSAAELLLVFQAAWPRIEPRAVGSFIVAARDKVRVRPLSD